MVFSFYGFVTDMTDALSCQLHPKESASSMKGLSDHLKGEKKALDLIKKEWENSWLADKFAQKMLI